MKTLKQITLEFSDRNNKLPLERQIFNKICMILGVVSLFAFAQSFFIQQPFWVSILFFFASVIGIMLFWLSNFRKGFNAAKLIFIILLYSISILGWFYNAGVNGTVAFVLIAINIFLIGFYPKKYLLLLVLNIATYTLLVTISYFYPQSIQFSYIYETDHVFDMTTSYSLTVISIVLVLKTILNNYNKANRIAKENEENLNSLINNRDESIWSIDTNYNYIIANNFYKEEYFAAFNIDIKKGMNVFAALPVLELKAFWKQQYDIALSGEKVNFEFDNQVGDKFHYYEGYLNPIISDGKITGVSGMSVDVSDRKEAEQALIESEYLLAEAQKISKMGGWSHDVQSQKMTFTDTIFEIYGKRFTEAEDGLQAYHPEDKELVWNSFSEAISKQKPYDLEVRFINAQGECLYVRTIGRPVIENGNVIKVNGILMDITEQKTAELKLKASEHKLDIANTTKDKLFSIIAHDLRSPLNSILGFSELLIDKIQTSDIEKSKKFATIINTSAKSNLSLIDNLLTWARTQTEQIGFTPKNLDLHPIVEEVFLRLNSTAWLKNISLISTLSDDIGAYADNDMLRTIIRNLVSNAIKFTDSGGKIDVNAVSKQDHIEISVADNGTGIDKENQKKLFGADVNFTKKGTANESGSGLGLMLCKEFVEKHGGKIWLESEEGQGSTFYFTIPYNPVSEDEKFIESIYSETDKEVQDKKLKILVVDDDEVSHILIMEIIQEFSSEILHSNNGIEAVEACRNNPDIDLVLMDIKMPEMNGHEATRQIRQFNKDVIIIAQTAYAFTGDKEKAIVAGCNNFITKPINETALNELIKKYFIK